MSMTTWGRVIAGIWVSWALAADASSRTARSGAEDFRKVMGISAGEEAGRGRRAGPK
jgi:hypothetical protein